LAKKKILVVDDNLELNELIKETLEETGRYEVLWEVRGSYGLITAKQFKPDLILMDLLMPDIPGNEVAQQLAQDEETKKIPVVYFTVIVSKDELESHAGYIGGHPFLAKPATIEELMHCVEKNLAAK